MDEFERKNAEFERIKKLNEFDLDYRNLQNEFQGLVQLAANITDTDLSLINLIDNYSQWTVTSNSSEFMQINREDSVCQYTIHTEELMEIPRLDEDARFSDKPFVKGSDGFKYYLGIPLKTQTGENIGALCVIDYKEKNISSEKKKLLGLVADEVVKRLEYKMKLDLLQEQLNKAIVQRNQMAHDVRGPVGGILGLTLSAENETLDDGEFGMYMEMIKSSASKLMDFTDDILDKQKEQQKENYFNLSELKKHLHDLYVLAALNKQIKLEFIYNGTKNHYRFSRRKLLPIVGNLIANSIKFTAPKGKIEVKLDIIQKEESGTLQIEVRDNGKGISKEKLQKLTNSNLGEDKGTSGEKGYGLGIRLVTDMVGSIGGKLDIISEEGKGTTAIVEIPVGL
ncbi:GAF sensor signal transduction histidine kinase [Allomuricauda ruestringensis DSM 13258]|uniref:histidine kinase n=1 Tax=Allomuricauda ruestringensis (strain DSM 13258 / CIP 107369 / LMG 19739 / B1) TaxID=886377 RepID=G2PIR7_ALLRU|nr:GAF domain-containing sensor histidine kinase [Allomuricauda ruestringensis]AEM71812.1 GAF sensor signal transduction histidine kinase [Allomuricauda ruestringensis DSM 13258]